MRQRMASPILPFDLIPTSVVETAKRVFDALLGRKRHDERSERGR